VHILNDVIKWEGCDKYCKHAAIFISRNNCELVISKRRKVVLMTNNQIFNNVNIIGTVLTRDDTYFESVFGHCKVEQEVPRIVL